MKKILLISFCWLFIASSALAATSVSFSPISVNIKEKQNFNLTITVKPQETIYTAKIEVRFPANLLKVNSFSLNSSWMALSQSGYDLIDNENGILIKTAGYTGGSSTDKTFGTISFSAKKEGTGSIDLNANSLVLDAENQNVLSASGIKTSVIITKALITSPPETPFETPAETPEEENIGSEGQPIQSEQSAITENIPSPSFFASVMNILSLGTQKTLVAVIVLIVIVAIIIYLIFFLFFRKKKGIPKV